MYAHKYITYTIYTDVHITPNADTYFARFNGSARGDLPHGGLGAWTLQRRLHELDQRTHSNLTPQLASLESMDRKKGNIFTGNHGFLHVFTMKFMGVFR